MTSLVYLAGPLTPKLKKNLNPAIDYLLNIRDMIEAAKNLILKGYSVYCPALDFLYFLILKDDEMIDEKTIKDNSLKILRRCDFLVLLPGWEDSQGVKEEVEEAIKYRIPIKLLEELLK